MKLLVLSCALIILNQNVAFAHGESHGSSGTRGGISDDTTTAAFYPEITKEALDKAVALHKEIPIQKDSMSGDYVISAEYLAPTSNDKQTASAESEYYVIPDYLIQNYPNHNDSVLRN